MLMNSFASAWGHTPPIGLVQSSLTDMAGAAVYARASRING